MSTRFLIYTIGHGCGVCCALDINWECILSQYILYILWNVFFIVYSLNFVWFEVRGRRTKAYDDTIQRYRKSQKNWKSVKVYFAVYGFKILCEKAKVPFEIMHVILNACTTKYAFHEVLWIWQIMISYGHLCPNELSPCLTILYRTVNAGASTVKKWNVP